MSFSFQTVCRWPFSSLWNCLRFFFFGTRDQIANIRWIIKKAREFQKNIYFCFIHYAKAFDCVDVEAETQIIWPDAKS